MRDFKCWEKDEEIEADDAEIVREANPRDAATTYAERRYPTCDYPEEQTIMVRDPEGNLFGFTVDAEPDVHFMATEIDLERTAEEKARELAEGGPR